MKLKNIVLLISALLALPSLSSAQSETIDPQKHLASLYELTIRDPLLSRIANPGLAPSDAESTADAALMEYARCTIEALENIDNPAADVFLISLNEGLSAEDLDTKLQEIDISFFADFYAELNSLTEPCRLEVDARLGIPAGS